MPTVKERLVISEFRSPIHEAVLGLLVASSHIRSALDDLMASYDLSVEQYNILRILRGVHPEGHTHGEIGKRMIDRSPDISRRITSLEGAGLAERAQAEKDRRVVYVTITQKGLDLLTTIDPQVEGFEKKIGEHFTADECERFSDLCSRFLTEDKD